MLLYQNTPVYGKRFKVFKALILWGIGALASIVIPLIPFV
jgi:hypothetical protein